MGVGYLTGQGGGGSNIKSIQRGSVTPWNNTTQTIANITINVVDISKSILLIRPNYRGTYGFDDVTSGLLTTSTNLQLIRSSKLNAVASVIYWEVIEFNNVKSLQKGYVNTAGGLTARNETIPEVNVEKSTIFTSQINSLVNSTTHKQSICGADLTTPTNLALYSDRTDTTVYWQVIEFK